MWWEQTDVKVNDCFKNMVLFNFINNKRHQNNNNENKFRYFQLFISLISSTTAIILLVFVSSTIVWLSLRFASISEEVEQTSFLLSFSEFLLNSSLSF